MKKQTLKGNCISRSNVLEFSSGLGKTHGTKIINFFFFLFTF